MRDPPADGWPPWPGLPNRPPPPRSTGGIARGPKAPPHSPPPLPLRPESGRGGGTPHPPPHPPPLGSHRRGPPPPQGRGGAPTLRRNGDAARATAAGPAPANPHRRAPHDPPITTAPSEVTEGCYRSAGAPGGAVHGPPLTPPTPGRHFSPDRRKGARRRHGESQKGVPQAAARNESREAAARHPPPPPAPPPARQPRGPRPPRPEAGGMGPPRPRGEPECDPPPRSSRWLTWGPRRTSGPTPAHRDAAQIVPREAG